jgi:hypothetical protein
MNIRKLKRAYTELVVNRHQLDGWTTYRVGCQNEWKFFYEGTYMGSVAHLPNGLFSIKY